MRVLVGWVADGVSSVGIDLRGCNEVEQFKEGEDKDLLRFATIGLAQEETI